MAVKVYDTLKSATGKFPVVEATGVNVEITNDDGTTNKTLQKAIDDGDFGTVGGGISKISSASDVNIDTTSLKDAQVLSYDNESGKWVNKDSSSSIDRLVDIADVDGSGLKAGSVLKYSETKQKWIPATIETSSGTASSSNEFTDYFKKKLIGIEENANYFDVQNLQAVNIALLATDADHRTVSETEKSNWNDKYTKSEIDGKLSGLAIGLDWKDGVDDYVTLLSTYSNPEKNWTVPLASGEIYTYNGTKWVQINMSATPVVNETVNGLMTPSMLEKLNGIDENANNFSIDDITADDIADGLSKVIMTSEERLLLKDIPNLYRNVNTKILEKDLDSALLTKLTTKDGDLIDDDLPSTNHTYSSAQIEELFERLTTRTVDPDMDAWFV